MVNELVFGKDESKFVIKQNIPLDELIDGEPIKREYEVIVYNALVPVSDFPELEFVSRIIDQDMNRVVRLFPELMEKYSRIKVLLRVLGGMGGSALGAAIGGIIGAAIGGGAGVSAGEEGPKLYDQISKQLKKINEVKRTEIIKGVKLRSYSDGVIPIDDWDILIFGLYKYTNRLTQSQDEALNRRAIEEIMGLIKTEMEEIHAKTEPLSAQYESGELREGSPNFREYEQLRELFGILKGFEVVFNEDEGLIYLHNKIEINSDYKPPSKLRIIKKGLNVGNIQVITGRKSRKSKEGIYTQVISGLYGRDYFLESALTLDLKDVMSKKRDDLSDQLGDSKAGVDSSDGTFPLHFYVLDKIDNIRIYGVLDLNIQNNEITRLRYFDNLERVVYEI